MNPRFFLFAVVVGVSLMAAGAAFAEEDPKVPTPAPAAAPEVGEETTFYRLDKTAMGLRYTEKGVVFEGKEFVRNGEASFRHVEDFGKDGCPNGEPGRFLQEIFLTPTDLVLRSASIGGCGDDPEEVWSEWFARYSRTPPPADCTCAPRSYCFGSAEGKKSLEFEDHCDGTLKVGLTDTLSPEVNVSRTGKDRYEGKSFFMTCPQTHTARVAIAWKRGTKTLELELVEAWETGPEEEQEGGSKERNADDASHKATYELLDGHPPCQEQGKR